MCKREAKYTLLTWPDMRSFLNREPLNCEPNLNWVSGASQKNGRLLNLDDVAPSDSYRFFASCETKEPSL